MNILIVGNGFDLSHYLPTKYDHFMVAMEAIENWDVLKGDMNFDDLFGALYEKKAIFLIKQK
ncbi:AbiH family protein [Acinetobacter johnsonii]|uniref:AbiH family protein n=1 Tax=Acinetobacter johnsonii TaxID=40214 RepID=UPI002B05CEF2|nr:AbiH family protein [Acinetobacter johnsonii]